MRWPRRVINFVARLVVLQGIAVATLARAQPRSIEVTATVDPSSGVVTGRWSAEVSVEADAEEVVLWLYADRTGVAPPLDERTGRWIYPGEIDLGGMRVDEVTVDGVPATPEPSAEGLERARGGTDVRVPTPRGHGPSVRVEARFTVRVPHRFGRLGRAGGRLSLAAPWYPLVVHRGAWWFDVAQRIEVHTSSGVVVTHAGSLATRATFAQTGPYVPVYAAESGALRSRTLPTQEGGVTLVESTRGGVSAPNAPGEWGLHDPTTIDRLPLLAEAWREARRTTRWLEIPAADHLVVWAIPTRTELAATAPGVVLVSDRVFEIFPIEETRGLHRRSVTRAVFRSVAEGIAQVDAPEDRGWAADTRAVILHELDEERRRGRAQRVEDLLQPLSFHPAVDQLLYAPQVAFEDAYFGSADEPDFFRDDPVRARAPLARGRRIMENVRQAVDRPRLRRWMAMAVHARRPLRDATIRVLPSAEEHLAIWLRSPALETNYRLAGVVSEAAETGHTHRVTVERQGDRRAQPVSVEVTDRHGQRTRQTLTDDATREELVFRTDAPLERVEIDPEGRASQSARLAEGHPRADDATSQPWRLPLLNNFSLDVLVSERNVTGLADVTLRQRYDLEHSLTFRIARTVARTTGRIRYLQGVGPLVHTNRRALQLGGSLALGRVESGFVTGGLGGWSAEIEAQAIASTVSFLADPRQGYTLVAQLAGSGTLRDDGSLSGALRGALRASVIVPLSLQHALFLLAAGGFTAGDPLPGERQILGGRAGLRGYANSALIGSGTLLAVIEERATVASDLAVNVFHGVWLRELQLASWLAAGGLFGAVEGSPDTFASEFGVGLRFQYEYGGVQPGVIAVDAGIPWFALLQGERITPVGLTLSFDQYY